MKILDLQIKRQTDTPTYRDASHLKSWISSNKIIVNI